MIVIVSVIVIVIVIVIVSVGLVVVPVSSRPAQAPDSPVDYRYYMDVVNPRTSICIGETVHYTVIVNRTPAAGDLAPKPAVRSRAASASPQVVRRPPISSTSRSWTCARAAPPTPRAPVSAAEEHP